MQGQTCCGRQSISRFFQSSFNIVLTRLLTMSLIRAYIYLLGMYYMLASNKERKDILLCQHHALRDRLRPALFYRIHLTTLLGTFEHYYEKLVMAHKPLSRMKHFLESRLRITDRHYLDEVKQTGKGAILVTGHFGAVEFLPLALAIGGYRIAMIVRYKTRRLKEELMARAAELNITLIDADEPGVVFKALQALKDGRLLITECDEFREWRPSKDKQVHVFGRAIPMDKTLDFFYLKTRAPAFLGLMRRDKDGYTLCIEPLADGKNSASLARRAWQRMEQFIMLYPCQWYQWRNLLPVFSPTIDAAERNAHQKDQYLPAKDPVLHANIA